MSDKQIISIKEARKVLGREAKGMTDEELTKLINDMDFLARYVIRKYLLKIGDPDML